MGHKILVADDSSTIQKVVSITLANERCDLVEAESTDELFKQIESDKFTLVLLDFNLSEKYTGYELATMIKEKSPGTKVIAMLGTFDTVDDDKITECGIEELVVKPFESSKFIQSCRKLISEVAIDEHVEELTTAYEIEDDISGEVSLGLEEDTDPADEWVTNTPDIENNIESLPSVEQIMTNVPNLKPTSTPVPDPIPTPTPENMNPLTQELEGWGMEVPSVIDETIENLDSSLLPPMIDDVDEMPGATSPYISFDSNLNDIEEIEEVEENQNVDFSIKDSLEMEQSGPEDAGLKPMFQSIDDFAQEDQEEPIDAQDKTVEIQIEQFDLEKEIEEEENPENFWAVDDGEDPYSAEENMALGVSVKVSTPEYSGDASTPVAQGKGISEQDKQDIIEALTQRMRPIIEEVVKELCESEVDKVAWEVIPDLAENLITKEIKEISESIQ